MTCTESAARGAAVGPAPWPDTRSEEALTDRVSPAHRRGSTALPDAYAPGGQASAMQEGLLAAEDRDAATAGRAAAATAADATADAPSLSGTFVLLTAAGLYADWTSTTGCPRPRFVSDPVFGGKRTRFTF